MTAHRLRNRCKRCKNANADQIENGHICENIVQNRSQADFQKGKR